VNQETSIEKYFQDVADLITYTDINTGTSCNSGKASQFMTPAKNSAASTSSTTSRVGLSSFIAKKKTTHLHQKFVGKLKQYIVTILSLRIFSSITLHNKLYMALS
jgi:hypothetical protein